MTSAANIILPDSFTIEKHRLLVSGRTMSELADEAGGTPFFAYSREAIFARIGQLRSALPGDVGIHYAMKANPLPALVEMMSGLVDGIDIASGGELEIALNAGVDPVSISFAGPGKTDAELTQSVQAGVLVNLESDGEMRRLAAISSRLGIRPRVAVRVNPAFELRQSGMHMGGGAKPFGVDEEQVPALLDEMASLPLDFHGFHIFSGSQILSEDVLMESQRATIDLALRLSKHAYQEVRYVNLGGGFGVPYFPGEKSIDLNKIGISLDEALKPARVALPQAHFALELGRFLVAEAGIYVARIVDRKVSRGKTFLIVDGGLHHNLALSGNFGQVIRKNYPVGIADKIDQKATETVDVVGCLCTPLDRLGDDLALPRAEVGDFFVVFQSGAYGASASPATFLGHGPAGELVI